MSHSKFGLKALGLCLLAALSVMAFVAAGAQANGHWFVNLVLLNSTIEVEALKGITGSLLSKFGLTPITINCSAILVDDGLLFSNGSSLGTILFSSCETKTGTKEETQANCKPLEPIVAPVVNLLIKHNNESYILFSPKDPKLVFTTLHLGAQCAAGQNVEVTGHTVAECGVLSGGVWSHLDCALEKVEPEIREVPDNLILSGGVKVDVLKFGANVARIDGDIKLALKAPHAGVKWGGLAK